MTLISKSMVLFFVSIAMFPLYDRSREPRIGFHAFEQSKA